MKATLLMAVAAAASVAMGAAQAQDMQATPVQAGADQQSAQGAMPDAATSSYGGTMSTTKASGGGRDAWIAPSGTACTTGLSCNIYQGQ
jgi:hypothetical protein